MDTKAVDFKKLTKDSTLINIRIKDEDISPRYGFCDGTNIFLHSNSYGNYTGKYYSKVVSFGRYMLIDDTFSNTSSSGAGVAVGASYGLIGGLVGALADQAVVAGSQRGMIIDMNTRAIIPFSHKAFMKLLESYPEYLKKYNKFSYEKQDFDLRKAFLDKINEIEAEKRK